jgi:hypothetical protein
MKVLVVISMILSLSLSACCRDGSIGSTGLKGDPGNIGAPGLSLVSTQIVATNTQCPSGGYLLQIAQDTNSNGLFDFTDNQQSSFIVCNGQVGTQVSMVQLCTGVGSYPSSFPEFGTCVDGKLYGVYWDHTNSWQAELYPGHYSSTSSSVSCSFTVGANCQVIH